MWKPKKKKKWLKGKKSFNQLSGVRHPRAGWNTQHILVIFSWFINSLFRFRHTYFYETIHQRKQLNKLNILAKKLLNFEQSNKGVVSWYDGLSKFQMQTVILTQYLYQSH